MKIESISISRRALYELKDGDRCAFKARVAINGEYAHNASITISIDEEQLEPIIAIVSRLVAENMADAAEKFREEVQAALIGLAIEQEQLEDQSNDIPF